MTKQYSTYIFDLDGTITDTLTVWLQIFREGLKHFDIVPPPDEVLARHTHDWKEMLKLGLPANKLDDFVVLVHKLAGDYLPKAPLHDGALETLEALKSQHMRVGIFSTMDRPIFEPAIKQHGLDGLAEVTIAGTDVAQRKPHPDGILKALKDMQIDTADFATCVYMGDKDTDVQAAYNAGIDSILYYPPAHQPFYNQATLLSHQPTMVINSWSELLS